MLNKEELKNLLALVNRAQITGGEAATVAVLQQKLAGLLAEKPEEIPNKYAEPS